ncbi:MAG TPA: L,D-transpeptidase [Gemmatimonadaceae bacterium]|nr:L,D-transpeptidase [Gemmatimonadaceae bacterium]
MTLRAFTSISNAFRDNARLTVILIAGALVATASAAAVGYSVWQVRYHLAVSRLVFNRNWALLDELTHDLHASDDTLHEAAPAADAPSANAPYIVVSIADRRMWYKMGNETLYSTRVAVGSGKTLVKQNGRDEYRFDTPRGRLVVQSKDVDPPWVPPDWHFVEIARKRKLKLVKLKKGDSIPAGDSSFITVAGSDVVRKMPDGTIVPFETSEGHEIVVGKELIVPPFGTNQRKYRGVLGSHRLNLGDGYALHGTNEPASVGKAVSHGCVRLRNEDIDYLYGLVPVGTAVYIY